MAPAPPTCYRDNVGQDIIPLTEVVARYRDNVDQEKFGGDGGGDSESSSPLVDDESSSPLVDDIKFPRRSKALGIAMTGSGKRSKRGLWMSAFLIAALVFGAAMFIYATSDADSSSDVMGGGKDSYSVSNSGIRGTNPSGSNDADENSQYEPSGDHRVGTKGSASSDEDDQEEENVEEKEEPSDENGTEVESEGGQGEGDEEGEQEDEKEPLDEDATENESEGEKREVDEHKEQEEVDEEEPLDEESEGDKGGGEEEVQEEEEPSDKNTTENESEGMFFEGCYADTGNPRDLPKDLGDGHTHDQCYQSCKDLDYAFFGMQWKGECYCGNSFGSYGPTECVNDCAVDKGFYGGMRNCVYNIDHRPSITT